MTHTHSILTRAAADRPAPPSPTAHDEAGARPHAGGLAEVVVADTCISEVDGTAGRLLIAGEPLAALAQRGFEGACAQLWASAAGRPVGDRAAASLRADLGLARQAAHAQRARWMGALAQLEPLAAVRAALAQLELPAPQADAPPDTPALQLTAALAVMLSAHARGQRGAPPIAPDPEAGHAHDFLRMLHARAPRPAETQALDQYLCTVIDHGFNASTFAARVVASTGADLMSAVLAALGALSGPLHGGAPGPVLDMLDAIGEPARAHAWLEAELAVGRRIMGMGHRVYRVRDPRAAVLQRALEALAPDAPRLRLARHVEQVAEALLAERHPGRSLRANVEMYTALLLDGLGLDRSMFTAVFALARCAGWCAHVREQQRCGRLIRPRARYVGRRPQGSA